MLLPLLLNGDGILGIGGAGGVSNGFGRTSFGWEKWRKAKDALKARKRLEKRQESLLEKIGEQRRLLDRARRLERIQIIQKRLEALDEELEAIQVALDQIEMEEVMLIYALAR